MEDAIYDSQALRNFMGIDLCRKSVPDATTLMGFRHLLEANDLTKAMLVEVNVMLMERGLLMTKGTLVDATLIAAPSSTKNQEHGRDPEMHQAKKRQPVVLWHEGAHWRGQGFRSGAYVDNNASKRQRHQPDACVTARARKRCLD